MPVQISCPTLNYATDDLAIRMPGGVAISAMRTGLVPQTLPELVQGLFGQLNTALAPFQAIFSILETIQVIFETIKAVATLNPVAIADQLPTLIDAIAAIASLFPPVGMILTIADTIKSLIQFIRGLIQIIDQQIAESLRIAQSQLIADKTGFTKLAEAIACATAVQAQFVLSMNNSFKPINIIIDVVNSFMGVIGLGQFSIPSLTDLDPTDLEGVKDVMTAIDDFLGVVLNFLP